MEDLKKKKKQLKALQKERCGSTVYRLQSLKCNKWCVTPGSLTQSTGHSHSVQYV